MYSVLHMGQVYVGNVSKDDCTVGASPGGTGSHTGSVTGYACPGSGTRGLSKTLFNDHCSTKIVFFFS
jgi:hypothetical protein